MKKVGVAILGFGTVGGGTYKIINSRKAEISKSYEIDLDVTAILVRNKEKAMAMGAEETLLTTEYDDILLNSGIGIVAECIGGIEPARTYILKALKAGKNVVTANKELLAKHWNELETVARESKVGIYFEATCAGGVPIIRTMTDGMQANNIVELKGIINGTTNYILSRMTDEGARYQAVLKDAQDLGFAEANPTADVDAYDAMYKLSILSTLAFGKQVPIEYIYREGISKITAEDISYGKDFGFTIKLLAIAKAQGGKFEVRVHPVFIANSHPLASVNGSFNAIFLVGDSVGDVMLYGRGAGALPTGSAVVSDIVYCATKSTASRFDCALTQVKREEIVSDFESEYYLRLSVHDKPGVLSKIAGIFAKNNVSITSMQQKAEKEIVPIIFFTHKTSENNIRKAVEEMESMKEHIVAVDNLIRVER